MKWGIRRTPEQLGYKVRRQAHDLTAKTIPAGTKCFRIATKDDPGVAHGKDTYVAYLPVDRANIRSISPWLMSVRGESLDKAYEREYEITKDIKVASYEEVAAIRRELMSKPEYREEAAGNFAENRLRNNGYSLTMINDVKDIANGTPIEKVAEREFQSNLKYYEGLGVLDQSYKRYAEQLKKDKDDWISYATESLESGVEGYKRNVALTNEVMSKMATRPAHQVTETERRLANMAMDMVYGREGINKETLQKELKKRGYDAMYDNGMISVNSRNRQEAYEPLVLFNGGALKETGGRYLTDQDVAKAEADSRKWMAGVEKDAKKKRIAP